MTGPPPPGWYPDPGGRSFLRYWDGRAWTAATRGDAPTPPRRPGPVERPSVPAPAPARPALPTRVQAVVLPGVREQPVRAAPGPAAVAAALAALIPALVGALTIIAPIAYGLELVWPPWGAAVPFVAWAAGAVLASWPNEPIQRALYGYRDPTAEEHRRLGEPSLRALRRLGVRTGRHRLMILESGDVTAPPNTGHTVVLTSHAAGTLPADQIEAVLVHELSHHIGLHAAPVFCHAQLTLPTRGLWWLLTHIWRPVRRTWRMAVRWHTPFGFLVTFLLAIAVAVIFVISAVPAGIAVIGVALSGFALDRTEYTADRTVAAVGLGPQLLSALETAIQTGHTGADRTGRLLGLPPLAVRRAQRLRRSLA